MSHLETIKANLKRLASDSLELALKELERLLSPNSPQFNSFLLLKGQFKKSREEFLLGILSPDQNAQTYARLMSAFLQMTGELSQNDLIPEKEAGQKSAEKRGELLYHIPHTMQVMREEKCVVRIAWTEAALFENWVRKKDNVHRRNLRIAEIMGVELMSRSEDAPFSIKSLHSTVQFLDEEEYTEWIFYVKPLRAGNYPLVVRISVIEMRDNREVKRELVLEEQINVSTETPQVEAGEEDMVRAPLAYFAAGGTFVEAPAFLTEVVRRYGALLALVLVGTVAFFSRQKQVHFVVVPPNANESANVDTSKMILPIQRNISSHRVAKDITDPTPDIKNENNFNTEAYLVGQYDRWPYPFLADSILKDTDKIDLHFVQTPQKDILPHSPKDSLSDYLLAVYGSIVVEGKIPIGASWPDYVFSPNYHISTLDSTILFKHLPEITVSRDSINSDIELRALIEKIEELTLYLIELQKENEKLKQKIKDIEKH